MAGGRFVRGKGLPKKTVKRGLARFCGGTGLRARLRQPTTQVRECPRARMAVGILKGWCWIQEGSHPIRGGGSDEELSGREESPRQAEGAQGTGRAVNDSIS